MKTNEINVTDGRFSDNRFRSYDSSAIDRHVQVFTNAMSWENAQRQCENDSGSLITINSDEVRVLCEYSIILNLFDRRKTNSSGALRSSTTWFKKCTLVSNA